MFRYFKNKIKEKFSSNKEENPEKILGSNFEKNIDILASRFCDVSDVYFRQLKLNISDEKKLRICLVYIDNLIDKEQVNKSVIKPITSYRTYNQKQKNMKISKEKIIDLISEEILNVDDLKKIQKVDKICDKILEGGSILLVDDIPVAIGMATQGWTERAASQTNVENTVRGPQEAFTENSKTNIGLIRRRIKSSNLKIVTFTKGLYTKTKISIVYLEGVASSNIVKETKKRINDIQVGQMIGGCRQVSELIEDNPLSLFDTIYETERPDVITSGILEGRVGIVTDGCPTALLVPKLFMENLTSAQDYYYRFWVSLFIRVLRFIAYITSTLLPALYVAIVSYHHELIPMTLASTIYQSRAGVPFPIFLELLLFLILFEMIKEAGATVPTTLSTSITIVGTLILGQAAITAGFLSADGVIIGSITGISIFLIPVVEFSMVLFFIRIIFIIVAAVGGIYGMTLTTIILLAHLASLRSFGVPYLSPVAPLQKQDLKDFFMRVPYLLMSSRPESIETKNSIQQNNKPFRRFFFKYQLKDSDKEGEE